MLLYVLADAGVGAFAGLVVFSVVGLLVRSVARGWALGPGLHHAQGPSLAVAIAVALGVSVVGWLVGMATQFLWSLAMGRAGAASLSGYFQFQTALRTTLSIVEWGVLAGLLGYGLLSTRRAEGAG